MLDLRFIRENREKVREAVKNKGEKTDLDALLGLDEKRRTLLLQADELKHERNVVSEKIAGMKKDKKDAAGEIENMRRVSGQIAALDDELRQLEETINDLLLTVPNVPHETVPVGMDEDSNVEIRSWGETPEFAFEARPHWELGQILGILDLPKAAKVASTSCWTCTPKSTVIPRSCLPSWPTAPP
jgi:seryl-tRNA synthetase